MSSAFEGVEPKEAEIRLRKRISDREKSEIMDLHFQGLSRDDIAKEIGVSTGAVSGVIKQFIDCADSESTEEAAEEYDVIETVESLRSLAVKIRKAGTSVEELRGVSNMLGRIKKLIDLDRLEGYIKAGESLGDKAHVEASVRMHLIEERTGRSHDDILNDLESKESRVRGLSSEIQHLQSQIKNLDLEREKAQTNLNAEKTRLEAELKEHLKQHSLTLERIQYIANIERELSGYGIELTQLEGLRRVLNAVDETGQDAKKIAELAKKVGSLRAQTEAEAKELDDTRELATKLSERVSMLEERLVGAEIVVEKCLELESMGWNRESLEKAILLAKEAGSPEEALSRLELFKPSVEAKAELKRIKAETEALKEKALKIIKQTLKNLSTLAKESSTMVNERIPDIVGRVSSILKIQISNLANEYNSLAEKHSKLQADFSKLTEEYRKHQKSLDDAISWSTLIHEPEKLPGDRISSIFFGVMTPRLEIWCKNKNTEERADIARELAKRAICLYSESAANFLKAPKKASVNTTKIAVISFALTVRPFHSAFMEWYKLHKDEKEASNLYKAHYHLEHFYKEGLTDITSPILD